MPFEGVEVPSVVAGDEPPCAPRAGATAPPSFEEIFEECCPFVVRVLGRLGVWAPDVPDVCQEVFVVVHERLGDFDGRASLRSWIYGICVRLAANHRRRRASRREQFDDAVPDQEIPPHQEGDVERRRAQALLVATLDALGEDKRSVFVLFELEELSMNEVAAALGCPLQTAYSRLHAARKFVVQSFRRHELAGKAR
jgi:RNA polymerase sigma-70 factor (ECF subfamily)